MLDSLCSESRKLLTAFIFARCVELMPKGLCFMLTESAKADLTATLCLVC